MNMNLYTNMKDYSHNICLKVTQNGDNFLDHNIHRGECTSMKTDSHVSKENKLHFVKLARFLTKKFSQEVKTEAFTNENINFHLPRHASGCAEEFNNGENTELDVKNYRNNIESSNLWKGFSTDISSVCNQSATDSKEESTKNTGNNNNNSNNSNTNNNNTHSNNSNDHSQSHNSNNNNNGNDDNNDNNNNRKNNSKPSSSKKKDSKYVCLHCSQTFVYVNEYTRHMRDVHNDDVTPLSCDLCKKKFKIEACYWKHMHLHQAANPHPTQSVNPVKEEKHRSATKCEEILSHNETTAGVVFQTSILPPAKSYNTTPLLKSSANAKFGFKTLKTTSNDNVSTVGSTSTNNNDNNDSNIKNVNLKSIVSIPSKITNYAKNSSFKLLFDDGSTSSNTNSGGGGNGEGGDHYGDGTSPLAEGVNVIENVKGKKVVVYYCTKCNKSYNRQLLYDEHLRVHAGLKPFCCEICGRMFARESNLAGHRQSHKQSKVYRCKVCKVKFSIKQKLVLHEMVHDLEEPFKCHLCIARFVREHDLQEHLMSHPEYASKHPFEGTSADGDYAGVDNMDGNQLVSQPIIEEIILDQNIISDSMDGQVIYSNMELPEAVYKSDGLLTNAISYLANMASEQQQQQHDSLHDTKNNNNDNNNNNNNNNSFNSNYNNFNNNSSSTLTKDLSNNSMADTSFNLIASYPDTTTLYPNVYSSTQPGIIVFPSTSTNNPVSTNLKQEVLSDEEDEDDHSNASHNTSNTAMTAPEERPTIAKNGEAINDVTHYLTPSGKIRPYIFCEVCGQPYKLMREYQDHMRRHTGHKPYCCEVCGKTFHRSKNLSAHRYSHVEVKRHKCDVCGKCFPLSTRLKIHQRIHTGEKPYECELCHQRFIRRNDYMDHRRKHTGGNTCVHCNKKYSKLETLREHINDKHNKVKPIKCKLCDERFSYSVALYRHMKKHRGQEKDLNKKVHFCRHCSKSFTRPCLLNRHILKAHPQQHAADADASE